MKKTSIIIGVCSIVTVVVFWLWLSSDEPSQANSQITPQENILLVEPQLVAQTVDIQSVSLKEPGFLVVRELIDKKIGQMIGVSGYLTFGNTQDLEIKLYTIPRDEAEVFVQVFRDNGDGRFSDTMDTPVLLDNVPLAVSLTDGKNVPAPVWETDTALIPPERITKISYDGKGFNPATVMIKAGDTVEFINDSQGSMWVASDNHPDHTILSTFDQFGVSEPGTRYRYTFSTVGQWRFHDHINPKAVGSVNVQNEPAVVGSNKVKNQQGYYEVGSTEFEALTQDPKVVTVNVHTPYQSEIAGTEIKIPYDEMGSLIAALPKDKTGPIAIYCRSGAMSSVAAKSLVAAGYTNVSELAGGMQAYEASGRTLITQ